MTHNIIIAIDGPAASGKGTLSRKIGETLGFAVLDTGLLYRGTALLVIQNDGDPDNADDASKAAKILKSKINEGFLEKSGLRGEQVSVASSKVSAIPQVRQILLDLQRNFARVPPMKKKGAVLDGRDIGTIVCPDADFKFFVTATPEVRAERRARERHGEEWQNHYDRMLSQTIERDTRDSQRKIAPLKPAKDAVILDTTEMGIETVFEKAMKIISQGLIEKTS